MDLKFEYLPQAISQLIEQNKLLLKAIREYDFSEKPIEEVLTLSRICELLELKRQTIYSYVSKNLFPIIRMQERFTLSKMKSWTGLLQN